MDSSDGLVASTAEEATDAATPLLPPTSPRFYRSSRHSSTSSMSSLDDEPSVPFDRLTVLDLLDSFSMGTKITQKINSTVRKKGGEFKSLALRQRDRVLKVRDDESVERLKQNFLKQVADFEARLAKATVISITEKLTFAFGLLNVFFAGYIIGALPEYFHVFYTAEMVVLLPVRIFTYRYKQYTYFLADLCYFVNALCLIFIWAFPSSEALFISCYALTFGTLSWAVVTWRNSLVLHSIEKTTSSAIHILPPVVFHVITHIIPAEYKAQRFPGANKVERWRMVQGLLWASITYLIWQSLYHYFITVRRKEKIKAGRLTSFEWLRKSYANTPLGRFVNGLPEPFPVFAFTLIQYGYQLSTMLLCPLWYASSLLSGLFMTFILFIAAYNGATYYIDIFGKRFQKEMIRLQAEVEKSNSINGISSAQSAPPSATSSPVLNPVRPQSANTDSFTLGAAALDPSEETSTVKSTDALTETSNATSTSVDINRS
ncbi:uncharacterized protein SAPINGB_P004399 [Magnusiomyces paraingens]|uniref:Glycerophosphocholine acyltransferase 1 n=1 Tax=Magnusiomyces paraingens TaxID=2606893 RepID=A0A5E8BUA1_9ASCO|nr:uncharacterized protein SAPINGB_P004399 [Saprochaete ingens]VVT55046.1 unnamed protein product [Saprochaete ingens]